MSASAAALELVAPEQVWRWLANNVPLLEPLWLARDVATSSLESLSALARH